MARVCYTSNSNKSKQRTQSNTKDGPHEPPADTNELQESKPSNEIEIDLNVQDSTMFLKQLAALCHNFNKQSVSRNTRDCRARVNPSGDRMDSGYVEHPQNSPPQNTPQCNCMGKELYMQSRCCSTSSFSDIKKKKRGYKEREKQMKKEQKRLQQYCKKRGQKIIKEFKMKEKMRLKEEKINFKLLKQDLKRENRDNLQKRKERLKRETARMKMRKKEEVQRLKILKEKIKKKCKGLKYIIDSDDD
ncbi:uncharacterized protein LOC108252124 [Diaphorina citri]|uniref:Uncharacterized protein LOC108252124 n=1 Tax=Diaphorina citri TaxID=121845 RepID=A0A1S4E8Y9_DIACI|nr:uncharacterized protein LOC108252124 [Diaphorina citri]